MTIRVFIDYDNMSDYKKRNSIKSIAQQVLTLNTNLIMQPNKPYIECIIRLYGGWYEEDKLTEKAEVLIAEIEKDFPFLLREENRLNIMIKVELARALSEAPSMDIFRTYRKKQIPNNIKCKAPLPSNLKHADCDLMILDILQSLIKKRKCSRKDRCPIELSDYLYRNEQKIVDTMMTCDMLYLQKISTITDSEKDHVFVVSADDDFIPAIKILTSNCFPVTRIIPNETKNNLYEYLFYSDLYYKEEVLL